MDDMEPQHCNLLLEEDSLLLSASRFLVFFITQGLIGGTGFWAPGCCFFGWQDKGLGDMIANDSDPKVGVSKEARQHSIPVCPVLELG